MELYDCKSHGSNVDNELFVVEGLSAANNILRARDANTQAVFALQGKPINAAKATLSRVKKNTELRGLVEALGCGMGEGLDVKALRYKRIVLLFDPDADGIHTGALVQIFLQKQMPTLMTALKVVLVRAPLFEIKLNSRADTVLAYSQAHFNTIKDYLGQHDETYQTTRFKGVASLSVELARSSCLSIDTRKSQVLTTEDTLLAVKMFG